MASRGGSTERPRRTPTLSRAVWTPSKAVLSALSYGPLRMRVTGKEHLPTDGPKTLNGLLLEKLETIPQAGTLLDIGDLRMEILQVADNAIRAVRVRSPVNPP